MGLTVAAHPEILIPKVNAIKILCFIVFSLKNIYDYRQVGVRVLSKQLVLKYPHIPWQDQRPRQKVYVGVETVTLWAIPVEEPVVGDLFIHQVIHPIHSIAKAKTRI